MQTDATTSNIVAPTMLDVFVSVLAMECKRMQHCCATLRRSRNKRNVGSYWLKSLTGFKLCATTRNNMQQGVQTDEIKHVTSNNVGSCWLLVVGCCCVRLHAALNCIIFTDFQHTKLYPFQNLSLGFILKIFLKFCKFQPRYSYKVYS